MNILCNVGNNELYINQLEGKTLIEKINSWYKRERKTLMLSVFLGVIITFAFGIATKGYSEHIEKGIAERVIRFHVIANSDSDADQALKLKVRDAVLAFMKEKLSAENNINSAREVVLNNVEEIKAVSEKVIAENKKDYPVWVGLAETNFPTKVYGDIAFPPGEYEALRIVIGNGSGKNWWCVLFPPLCFVDITQGKISDEGKDSLKNILTAEEYDIVVNAKSENHIPVKVKFKIVEWWQSHKI